jgi:hypothetical protein
MEKPDHIELWRSRIAAKEESGLSARAWCAQNEISANLFYYWKHRVSRGQKDARETDWLPAVICEQSSERQQDCVTLRIAGAVIEVHCGFNPTLLRDVVLALGSEQC